jgi:cytochrome b subunit of formate dehydrogenase
MSTSAMAVEDTNTGELTEAVYEHPLVIRLCHWVNAVSLFVLAGSGLQIFRAFPSFGAKVAEKVLIEWQNR